MDRPALTRALLLAALALAGCTTPEPQHVTPPTGTTAATPPTDAPEGVRLEEVRGGLASPVLALDIPGVDLAIVEQQGFLVAKGTPNATRAPLLDIRDRVGSGGERGFLGFAVHPDDPRVGVASYTDKQGDSVLSRVRLVDGTYDAAGEEVLLRVDQPFSNHNGGHVAFGPDGYLYYGLGDGGSAGDPGNRAQDLDDLLGSMLRLDVPPEGPLAIPPDNPYVGKDGRDEVWAKGLRNPWRFSFDRATGDLWIADVGQNSDEEINYQPASSGGGENYGWSAWEGTRRANPARTTPTPPVAPVFTYPTDEGCAVTGGHVYRGQAMPWLVGAYVFADYCNGVVRALRHDGDAWTATRLLDTGLRVSSFGEDADGEVLLVDHGGAVYRIVPG